MIYGNGNSKDIYTLTDGALYRNHRALHCPQFHDVCCNKCSAFHTVQDNPVIIIHLCCFTPPCAIRIQEVEE